ncbi:SGNH/GDSL hydrolase family protein [Flexivirga caeni]|nr:SGNH/GDSL hydrolase family protein [Flexivirga caeni]
MASALALVVAASGATVFAQSASAAPSTGSYYVALGDSLAAGYQPGVGDDKTGGYVGGVLAHLKQTEPGVQLENLACSGETTGTMLDGGKCTYPEGNQVAAAVDFLKAHSQVSLITLDIGANNVQTCATTNGIDMACVVKGLQEVATQLPTIVGKLRAAAPNARIVVANYYNPFLAAWLLGTDGQTLAKSAVALQEQLNGSIASAAKGIDAPTADVATAFSSTDFTDMVNVPPFGDIPLNVARICQWTWMCSKQNIHANDAGYAEMAKAVIAAIPAVPPTSPPTSPTSSPTSPTSSPTSSGSPTSTSGTATSTTTGPPIITDGGASGGSNDEVLVGAGIAAVGAAAIAGGALARIRRRRD